MACRQTSYTTTSTQANPFFTPSIPATTTQWPTHRREWNCHPKTPRPWPMPSWRYTDCPPNNVQTWVKMAERPCSISMNTVRGRSNLQRFCLPTRKMRKRTAKRIFDCTVVVLTLPIWLPVLFCVAVLVRLRLGAPVIFRQTRPGLHGQPFQMMKFRSMIDAMDRQGQQLPDKDRLTGFGRFLRSTSLDELPELWNVLAGHMSLVGPRPLLMAYLPLYSAQQARRHDVLPGITGWAQINGRNAISWQDKFALDVWYVDNQSFWLDVRILWLTIWRVLARSDTHADGHVTVEDFDGTN